MLNSALRTINIGDDGRQVPVGSTFGDAWIDTNVTWDQSNRYVVTSYSSDLTESSTSPTVEATALRVVLDNPPPQVDQPRLYMPIIAGIFIE